MKKSETILNALREPILLLDNELCAVMANPAFYRILQITPGQLVGKMIREFVSNGNATLQLTKVLAPVVESNGEVRGVEVVCMLPDSTQVILSINAQSLPADQNQPKMVLVELRDVTKERIAERTIQELHLTLERHLARLEMTNKELEAFSHSISHDLRTPLRLMDKVTHELLHDYGAKLPAGAIEIINMITVASQEMERLIDVLLKFSRTIQSPIRKRQVDLEVLAREVMEMLRGEQGDRVIEFVIETLPPCQVDRALFKEVLLNLLANSLKFTRPREKAQIHLGCLERAGETVYFIRDNGIGFDMEKASLLFTAFHRLHRSSGYEGSGIGLALVRRIVERHGGRIWCESEIDKGATFYFTAGNETNASTPIEGP